MRGAGWARRHARGAVTSASAASSGRSADGAVVSDEDFTTVHTDSRRSDWYVYSYGDGAAAGRPQGHFDFECTTLNYVLPAGRSWPQLSWTGATIQSDEDHKGFEKWWIEAAFLVFGKIRTEEQRSHHAPVNVTPFVVSAGGGIMGGHGRATALGQGEEWAALRAAAPERHPAQVSAPTGGGICVPLLRPSRRSVQPARHGVG